MRGLVLIVAAALLAAVAGGIAYLNMQKVAQQRAQKGVETRSVVVAAKDMTYGTKIGPEHLSTVAFPRSAVPEGAYVSPDSVLGQTTKVFLVKGEPILASKLSTVGGGLSVRIPETMRATSVKVNEVYGVSGFVLPGDRVDVMVTIDNVGGVENAVTRTIVQNSEILASGVKTETKKDNPIQVQTVTLLVTPKEAEQIALGTHEGVIHLALRNPIDTLEIAIPPTNTHEVMGGTVKAQAAAVPRRSLPPPRKVAPEPVLPPRPAAPPRDSTYTIITDGKTRTVEYPTKTGAEGQR